MKKLKTPAQRPRKAPSNQTGGTAWGKKLAAEFSRMAQSADIQNNRFGTCRRVSCSGLLQTVKGR